MSKSVKKIARKYTCGIKSIVSGFLAFVMLISAFPITAFSGFTDDGGFKLSINWMGNSDPNNFVYHSDRNENKLVRLRVNYRNESPVVGYASGELLITVKGINGALRNGDTKPVAIAADQASSSVKRYDWSYTYSSTTDTYTFTNNNKIESQYNLDGMFEIIWEINSRESVSNFSTDVTAKLRTANNEQTSSNTIKYSQTRVKDTYEISQEAKPLYTPEGLLDKLPAGKNHDEYTWAQYTINGKDTYKSIDVNGTERLEMWFREGAIVQGPLTKKGTTKVIDGQVYECWSAEKNVNDKTINPWFERIFVAYPKALYKDIPIDSYAELYGTYFEDKAESLLTINKLTIDLSEFGYKDIIENLYSSNKVSYGTITEFTKKHCTTCRNLGSVNYEHLSGGHEYRSDLMFSLNYAQNDAEYFDIEFTDDFIDVELKDGKLKQLSDDEYKFTKVKVAGTSSLTNINGIPIKADTYPVEIYVRKAGVKSFESAPIIQTVLMSNEQTLAVPDDTVAVRIKIKGIKESISSNRLVTVYYEFNTSDPNIRTNNGSIINNMYIKLYDQNGWRNAEYDKNPDTYIGQREYLRDLNTYGQTFDREYGSLHVLEVPNEFLVSNTITKANPDSDADYFYFNSSISSRMNYLDDGGISKFSQYSILPEGTHIAENIINSEMLLNNAIFSSTQNGVNDNYIRQHCKAEIIRNYKDSGRDYIAFHYDFSDAPIKAGRVTVSGIKLYSSKAEIMTPNKDFTMRAATLIDQTTGKWYSTSTDNNRMENGLWVDIDRDGNIEEAADFSSSIITIYRPVSSQLKAIKSVATSNTIAFENPAEDKNGNYVDSQIPTEYSNSIYTYRLSLSTGAVSGKNIVFCDVLETKGEWKGKFLSVDFSAAQKLIGNAPVVWYSSSEEDVSKKPDFSSGGWTTTMPQEIRSIAVDFGQAGILPEGFTASVFIKMLSPNNENGEYTDKLAKNNFTTYYTSFDKQSGTDIANTFLSSNNVPVKIIPHQGTIRLNKIDKVDKRVIKGVKFSLYKMLGSAPNVQTDTLIEENFITDENGNITVENLLYGNYYFVETQCAPGYILPPNEADRITLVSLNSENPNIFVSVDVLNDRKPGQFTLMKVNERDPSIKVQGAKFSVYLSDGTLVQDGNNAAFGLVTDQNGEMTVNNLPWGDYYLLEIEAPIGYELYKDKIPFTISGANDSGHNTVASTVKDPQKPAGATLTKYEMLEDGVTQTLVTVDGAVYQLYSAVGDKLLGTYITDDFGKIYADDLVFGDYYFKESIPAQGFSINPNKIPFTVTAEHTVTRCLVNTTNTRLSGTVWFQKVDDSGNVVNGAQYGLFRKDTNEVITSADFADGRETTGLFETNNEGIFEFNGLRWGEYYLKETKAPQGYELNPESYSVVISRQTVNKKVFVTAQDERTKGSVRLIKVSEMNESLKLPDAQFSLYRSDGSLVSENHTTGSDGSFLLTGLAWGSYYFVETKAPAGYGLNPNKIRFSVNYLTGGKVQELVVSDPAVTKEIRINKKIKTSEIVFAHGNPTFTFKLSGTEITSGKNREMIKTVSFDSVFFEANKNKEYLELSVCFAGLAPGQYTVSEMDTNRYVLDSISDVVAGSINPDGKSVAFDLENNSAASASFINIKDKQSLTSHASNVSNIVAKKFVLTSITAIWNGSVVNTDTLDRTQLTVYANYDDGSTKKLGDNEYNLTPDVFDSSMNGDYTVNVSYTEDGITRSDTFDIKLNAPVAFTWQEITGSDLNRIMSDSPENFTADGKYIYDGKTYDGVVAITGYTGSSSVVKFPTEVTGIRNWETDGNHSFVADGKKYRVIRLGSKNPTSMTSGAILGIDSSTITDIVLPNGLKEISSYAFDSRSNITGELTLPDSLLRIGRCAFRNNTNIKGTLVFSSNLKSIEVSAFQGCSGLTGSLIIPSNVKSLGSCAFQNCTGFNGNLTIEEGVETIGTYAFQNCSNLIGDIKIPDSMTKIDDFTFDKCSSLNGTLTISKNIKSIGSYAFQSCSKLVGDLEIPQSVETIGNSAFNLCSSLNGTLTLHDGITSIGSYGFYGCLNLKGTLKIPDKLTELKDRTFYNCKGLTGDITIPENIKTIGEAVFYGCSGFAGKLTLHDEITSIKKSAFESCTGLIGTLTIPNKLTTLPDKSFYNCKSLTGSIVIPESVTTIGSEVFKACAGFTGDIVIPDSVEQIGKGAFAWCSGLSGTLKLSNQLTEITSDVFNGCANLTGDLIIPNSVKTIGLNTFLNCSKFTSLTLSENLETISNNAFDNCKGFKGSLIIPDSVTTIYSYAFRNCSGFDGNLYLGSKLSVISYAAFNGCTNFTGNLVIPDNVTQIGVLAFSSCSGFDGELTLSKNITAIPDQAFYGCSGLTGSLVIPDNVLTIGKSAFVAVNFSELVLGASITDIGNGAFTNAKFTNTLTVPLSVNTIGTSAFYSVPFAKLILPNKFSPNKFGYTGVTEYY